MSSLFFIQNWAISLLRTFQSLLSSRPWQLYIISVQIDTKWQRTFALQKLPQNSRICQDRRPGGSERRGRCLEMKQQHCGQIWVPTQFSKKAKFAKHRGNGKEWGESNDRLHFPTLSHILYNFSIKGTLWVRKIWSGMYCGWIFQK